MIIKTKILGVGYYGKKQNPLTSNVVEKDIFDSRKLWEWNLHLVFNTFFGRKTLQDPPLLKNIWIPLTTIVAGNPNELY